MKKILLICIVFVMSNVCFAGQIFNGTSGTNYVKDDGTLAKNEWVQFDIDADGKYENYYFDSNGNLLVDTITPDGYKVNEKGQWVNNANTVVTSNISNETIKNVNDKNVNDKNINDKNINDNNVNDKNANDKNANDKNVNAKNENVKNEKNDSKIKANNDSQISSNTKVWICDTGKKYHAYAGCSKMKDPYLVTIKEAESKGYTPCNKKKCYGN